MYPDYQPELTEEWAPEGTEPREYNPGARIPLLKLSDGRMVVDEVVFPDGRVKWKIWSNQDHPNLQILEQDYPNVPRIVKQLYRRSFQLRMIRMTDVLPWFQEIQKVEEAWEKYLKERSND